MKPIYSVFVIFVIIGRTFLFCGCSISSSYLFFRGTDTDALGCPDSGNLEWKGFGGGWIDINCRDVFILDYMMHQLVSPGLLDARVD